MRIGYKSIYKSPPAPLGKSLSMESGGMRIGYKSPCPFSSFLAPLGRNSDGRDSEKPLGNGAGGAVWGACPSV